MLSASRLQKSRLLRGGLVLFALLFFQGCSLLDFQDSMDSFEGASIVISGRVEGASSDPVIVGALAIEDNSLTLISYKVLPQPGAFELIVPKGEYLLFAFADSNRNLEYNDGEVASLYRFNKQPDANSVAGITLTLGDVDREEIQEITSSNQIKLKLIPFLENLGRVVGKDDSSLSVAVGEIGLWQPMQFISQGHGGIFFLEPYDAAKIPVVFIHGVGGAPDNFRQLIEHMDTDRFQPWLVSYPSSFRLERIGREIYNALIILELSYRPKSMILVAHSMGGLVARQVIHSAVEGGTPEMFKSLVTIATPWGGHAMAAVGVKRSPVVIPNWIDMSPGSDFLARWQEYPLQIPHQLIFAYRNEKGASDEATDGTIVLSSQLAPHMMHNAKRLLGYYATHIGILSHQALLVRFDMLLE